MAIKYVGKSKFGSSLSTADKVFIAAAAAWAALLLSK